MYNITRLPGSVNFAEKHHFWITNSSYGCCFVFANGLKLAFKEATIHAFDAAIDLMVDNGWRSCVMFMFGENCAYKLRV